MKLEEFVDLAMTGEGISKKEVLVQIGTRIFKITGVADNSLGSAVIFATEELPPLPIA